MTNFGDMVIYDIHGSKLMDAILTEGAVLERELGKTDVVKLSWNSDCKETLPVGSYIVPFDDGLKYRLLDDYTPSEGSTSVKYEPVFNHPLAVLSRIPFLYDTTDQDGNPIKQQEWSYDGLTTNALEYACKAINEALGITDESKKFTYTLCGTVDPTISFSVSSNDILSVLSSMAQACKDNSSEWHLSWEHHSLYFGQIFINLGEKVPLLKVHDNINPATLNSSNEPYYNCFYPQGSSRNMSRKAQVGTGNVATLVRLGLNKNKFPDGCIYVDKDSNVITKDAFVQSGAIKQMVALSFDDVYPHIDLYAYNVRPRYRYLKNRQTNEIEKDANGKNKVYTTWYMRLAYPTTVKDDTKTLVNTTNDIDEHGKQVTHYWYDYELNKKEQVLQGHTLKGTFKVNTHATNGKYDALTQSLVGQPNGQDGFEFAYFDKNDAKEIPSNQNDGDSGINIKAGDYQIMFYQSGDIIIPTNQEEGLYPRGNNLPDFTCNIVVLFNIKQGQQEITSAQEELAKRTIKEIERRFKDNNNYTFSSNPVAFEEKNPNLHIGQKVIFNDGQGYELSTRVIKIESKIDFPFIQNVTVGNQAVKGAITQLKEDVKSILSGNFSGGGGLNASQLENVIKNFTLPRFLRKDVADEAKGHITFWQGLTALVKSFFNGVENNGDIRNKGDIINDGNITTKNLTVTDKATFFELEIQKAKAAGGMSVNSAGTFHIDAVEETKTKDGFVCYQRAEKDGVKLLQTCEVSDQMMCSNGMNILKGGKGNHFYWRKVTEAPKEVVMHTIDCKEEKCLKIVLSKTDHSENTVDIPKVGDDLVQMGNPDNKERQSVIMTCAYKGLDGDLKAPYWVQYDGVNDYKLSTHKRTWFAANGSQVTGNFKVQSDNGELESIEDYMKGLTTNTVVWHVAFSIRNITGKQGETFRLKYGRTEGENTSWYDDNPTHQGFNLLYAVIIDDATGNQQQAVLGEDLKVAKFFTGGSMTVHLKNSKTGETLAQDTIYPEAKQGKDGLDSVVFRLIPNIEKAVVKGTNRETAKVVLFLKYMITRQEGEKYYVELGRLDSFGLSLSIEPSWASFEVKWEDGKPYWVIKTTDAYANRFDDTPFFRVCLMQGGKVLDARTIGLQYEVESSFNVGKRVDGLDGKIDGISGTVKTLDGRVSGFETTIDHFSTEVKDKVSRTELKQTADGIEMKVSSSVNANLLWGSDLDLSGVQDKIQLAYNNGDVIQQNTAKKEELQRQLDATPTNDTAKRNDLQKKIDICNDEITAARNKISECKAAIQKHLGVGLNATKIDSKEWFEYLKGGGVGGSDAIKFYTTKDASPFAGLYWEVLTGASHNLRLKPNTAYTLSAWIRTEFDKDAQGYSNFVFEAFKKEKEDSVQRIVSLKFKTESSYREPVGEWTRVSATFTTEELEYDSVAMWMNGTKPATLYLCRPKLEEGDMATPWCAYDGTVEALLASGFSLKDKEFTATFDNFKVQNNKGEQTFFVDENGRINNGLLNTLWFYRTFTEINDSNFREYMTYVNGVFRPEVRGSYAFYWVNVAKTGPSITFNITSKSRHENTNFYPAPRIYLNYLSYMPKRNMVPGVLDNILLLGSEMVIVNKGDIAVGVVGSLCFSGYGFPSLAYHGNGYDSDEKEERRHYYQPLMISIDKGEVAHLRCRLIGDRTNVKIGWEYAVGKVSRWNDAISYHPYYQPSNLTDMADGNYPVNGHGEEFTE
nr:MAG TPA: tail protein [Crassvirales sp.]